jgi:nucleoside-diphosphate-sugar epimerase
VAGTKQLVADRNSVEAMKKAGAAAEAHYDAVIDTSALTCAHTEIAWAAFSEKTKQWIHLSSATVYKDTGSRAPHEDDEIGGAEVWAKYGQDKSAADSFLKEQKSGHSITIFRPPYIYGPGNNLDRETFIWSRLLRGRPVIIPGEGRTCIQFVHSFDLAAAFVLALRKSSKGIRIYNIGASEQPTLQKYVSDLAAISESKNTAICVGKSSIEFTARQYFPFRDYPCVVDTSRIRTELGWKPRFSFSIGFEQTLASYDLGYLKNKPIETAIEDQILAKISF